MAINFSLTLILLSVCLQASQTYILSYRAQIKDSVIISESFHLSEAMQDIQATTAQSIRLHSDTATTVKNIIKDNQAQVLEFMMKFGTHTRSHEKLRNNISSSLITITIPPSYITVDFKNDYAIITRLITY
ncbi:hypothetical protein JHD50_02390 [Sulfurimonas sp. MAG313]|nr:hypothetical protein [Sulfurimonas sp. MAG313]MDF1880161.1 hypothetical protein [Sulfurimonas sp. MAG313]